MDRLTSQRCSGIKSGYWSTAKKDELIQRLGQYEDTGLTPEEITARLSAPETLRSVPVIEQDKLAAHLERGKDDRFQIFSPD